jgi:hypothetical protein
VIRGLQRWRYGYSSYDEHMVRAKLEADREGMSGIVLTEHERKALDAMQLENRIYKAHWYLQRSWASIAREMGVSERKVRRMAERANKRRK